MPEYHKLFMIECHYLQELTQVEEMLISVVLSIMSPINCLMDGILTPFANSLPQLPNKLDILVIRKEAAADSHHNSCVR